MRGQVCGAMPPLLLPAHIARPLAAVVELRRVAQRIVLKVCYLKQVIRELERADKATVMRDDHRIILR